MTAPHEWARRGRPVLPVGAHKRPLVPHGLRDATTDAEQITRWWERWPDANVGVRTGAESGIVVLDIDGEEGADNLRQLEQRHAELSDTTSVRTPRGGQHYYFRHPGGFVKTTAGAVAPGIDVRGDGGYVLVPPSVGENGRAYEWDNEAPPAAMPPWLLGLVRNELGERPARRQPASTWVGMVAKGLAEGDRNVSLTRLVGHLLARDVDVRLVGVIAHLVNEMRCRPPLEADEVDTILESIAGREAAKRRRTGS